MSSWDRQATLDKYSAMLSESEDPAALIEELGTPTKLAIELARTYVPSPAPVKAPAEEELPADGAAAAETEWEEAEEAPAEVPEEAPEQIRWDLDGEPETPPAPAMKRVVKGGALAGYLVPAILIGIPIAVVLVCIGIPFIAAGAALIWGAVRQVLHVIALLTLFSDILLSVGAALCLCAVGLLLVWLGLWLSMELCWLWMDKVLVGLGHKLCTKEVPAE